ncbi:MAG: sialidase family protein, partial [Pyrinomonadaceae bacterium]
MRGSNDQSAHANTGTRWILISIVLLAFAACAIPLYRARASAPSSGMLNPGDAAPVTWIGTATGGAAPDGEASCTEGQNCDTFTLTLTGQPADWAGKKVLVKISWTSPATDYDLYVHKGTNSGPEAGHDGASPPTTSETVLIDPAVHGTGVFSVHVVYFAATSADQYHGEASVATPVVTPTPKPATQGTGVKPRYQNHTPTEAQLLTGKGTDAGEPTIGSNWKTGRAMFQSFLTTFRVTFNDSCPSTPSSLWEDKSPATSANSLDPILWTANRTGTAPNRTIVSQLSGTTSLSSYTDDDGETWIPSQGGSGTSGVDHQGIGGGPFHAPLPGAVYPNAVYYCSQDIAVANCALSLDGGQTYGPAVPIYNINECAGLHGHPKVAPDGTVYVPNAACISDGVLSYTRQAAIVSEDNGATWAIRAIPNSTPGSSDPSIEIGSGGKVYFGYTNDDSKAAVAVSDNKGVTWKNIQDVGAVFSIKNAAFPAVVAGDNNRAAFAFFGSTTAGDPNDLAFDGFWHLYIAHTYDGGVSWITVDATPNDPIQRGGIWLSGGSPIHRNLLDFFDATIDAQGRVLVGYDDGCAGGACVQAA